MHHSDTTTVERWRERPLLDRDGEQVGSISEIYVDRETGHPEWVLVRAADTSAFVPLAEAAETDAGLQVPYTRHQIEAAPELPADEELSPEEEERLDSHYGLPAAGAP